MKRKNNVNVISNSTVATVILSAAAMTLLSILLMAGASFAKSVEIGDEFGGPGIGMADSTWDGSIVNRIYGYGDLNGIVGDAVVETNALCIDGPTNYIEYTDANPINHYLIDMGPQSASNAAYSLHFISDGGPGMNVQSNELGTPTVYNDGGPGFMVYGLNGTERVSYVENGPKVSGTDVNPSDYLKLMNMKPGDFKFEGGSKADKLGK